jgi:hypothetical protein
MLISLKIPLAEDLLKGTLSVQIPAGLCVKVSKGIASAARWG